MQVAEVQQTIIEKDETIRTLRAAAALKEEMIWSSPHYWRKVGDGKDGPYCQQCFDKDKALIRLLNTAGIATCRTCWNTYVDGSHIESRVSDNDYDPFHALK